MKKLISVSNFTKQGEEIYKTYVGINEEREIEDLTWLSKIIPMMLKEKKDEIRCASNPTKLTIDNLDSKIKVMDMTHP